jgi:hypothetical protein
MSVDHVVNAPPREAVLVWLAAHYAARAMLEDAVEVFGLCPIFREVFAGTVDIDMRGPKGVLYITHVGVRHLEDNPERVRAILHGEDESHDKLN